MSIDPIVHAEPAALRTFRLPWLAASDLVMPEFNDSAPLFERAGAWRSDTRCYETPSGVQMLTEARAYDLYRSIAERTTGVAFDDAAGRRSVVGLRGSYPGTFGWHGNKPDRFNDTLVLLWIDAERKKHVREFPANTDTGVHEFGYHNSSSLRANRRYRYKNGWHRNYNALRIDETGYRVRDDANKNGHWDSDRNGWLPPETPADHDRAGSLHNIHMAAFDAGTTGTEPIGKWSAGCQVIIGQKNWVEFITNAWTKENDPVNYFLVDVRDIDARAWGTCEANGTHACPYPVDTLPFEHSADDEASGSRFETYNCRPEASMSGPERLYVLTVDAPGVVTANVVGNADIFLLDGNDAKSCIAWHEDTIAAEVVPGRYFIVADSTDSAPSSAALRVKFDQ